MTMAYEPGIAFPFSVQATVANPAAFSGVTTLYVYIVDPTKLLAGTVSLTQNDPLHYTAIVETSTTVPLGHYQGTFEVEFCKDAACSSQIAGSPFPLPYDLTVTNCPPNIGLGVAGSTTATVALGGSPPPDVTVDVSPSCQAWTASTTTPWLRVNGGAGTGTGSFTVSYLPSGLAVGTYSGSVTMYTQDGRNVSMTFGLNVIP